MINKSTFCTQPFIAVTVGTNGGMGPCCNVKNLSNIRNENILEYWKSDTLKDFRNKIISGEPVPECTSCYQSEKLLGESLRTRTLADQSFIGLEVEQKFRYYEIYKHFNYPLQAELQLGNLCNLKCITCNPQDSSSFLAEDVILKISNYQNSDYHIDEDIIKTNLNLTLENGILIDLRGGESMLMPVIKKSLLKADNKKCADMRLRIQTNGTIFDNEWKIIFKKFKYVEIIVSIDAIEQEFEYIRFPGKWNVVKENLDHFRSINNVKLEISCTLSNLNLLILDKLLTWAHESSFSKVYLSPVFLPEHFSIDGLPQEILDLARLRLEKWFLTYPDLSLLFQNVQSNLNLWQTFCKHIELRDSYRGNSIFNILPELKKHWNE